MPNVPDDDDDDEEEDAYHPSDPGSPSDDAPSPSASDGSNDNSSNDGSGDEDAGGDAAAGEAGTKMWAAVALRGISKKMKVAAAQRVVVSLRAKQCSLVWAIILTVHFAPAWPTQARTCQPTCPP